MSVPLSITPAPQPLSQQSGSSGGGHSPADKHFRTDHLLHNLGGRAFSGGIVTTISQAARFGLYLVQTVVLARMLTQEEFGLVMMGLALIQILHLFREAGLSTATVQQQTITHAQVSNLFWANLVVGLGCALVGALMAPVMSWYYHDSRLTAITLWLSLTLLAGGAAVQHLALLNRQMRFTALALIDLGAMVACLVVGIVMAVYGWGYWSLVGAQLGMALTEMALAWIASGWRPQLPKAGSGTRSMLRFGASITFSTLLRKITSNADSLLLGRFFGADAVGVYTRGLALIMRPMDQFLVPFDKVFVPVLSRLQDQPGRYRGHFLQVYGGLALISFPLAGLFLGLSEPLVLLALGPKWTAVVPIFAALSLTALYYPIAGASMWLLTTQRRNRDILTSGFAISVITLASFVVGMLYGPFGLALAFSLFGVLLRLPIQYFIVGRSGPVRTVDLWRVCFSHLPFWAVTATGAYLPQLLLAEARPFALSCLGGATGSLAALALAMIIPYYRREVTGLIELVKRLILKRQAAAA